MNKNTLYYFLKITGLTFFILIIINLGYYFVGNADFNNLFNNTTKKVDITNQNDKNFVSVGSNKIVASVGVAISTNIGTGLKQVTETPAKAYQDVMDISYILANKQVARDKIISQNMLLLNEYLNILKTDFKTMLNQSNDREKTLDSYISQLEFRYTNSVGYIQTLKNQRSILVTSANQSNTKVESNKTKMGNDFKIFDSQAVITDVDNYLEAKDEYTYSKTYIVFIDKFITYYSLLNSYNKKLLDTLINNRDLIIKNSQLVIPDSGTDLLKKLDLIYTEADYKKEAQSE
ncbi:MAG: hypothetical protein PHR68_01925 [Candidatus Gracilibacteria bacterium]|nr:hypothetical protein [Candidatus Gracilibacteria bacterium]